MSAQEKDREKLVKTASELFRRLGFRSVSMDDIARQLGMSKKTVYQIVENKDALVELVMEKENDCDMLVMQKNHEDSRDAIDEFLRNSRYFIRELRSVSPAAMHDLQKYYPDLLNQKSIAHNKEFLRSIADNLERGMEEGLYRSDLDVEVIANFYVGMVTTIVNTAVFPAQDRSLADIVRQHSYYHFNGITNQFGRQRVEEYLQQEDLD